MDIDKHGDVINDQDMREYVKRSVDGDALVDVDKVVEYFMNLHGGPCDLSTVEPEYYWAIVARYVS